MRTLVEFASKPVSFSFLLAIAVGTALFQTGRQAVPYADQAARSDLNALAYKVASAYLIFEWQGRTTGARTALIDALKDSVVDQRVAGATVRDQRGEVVAQARESQAPLF